MFLWGIKAVNIKKSPKTNENPMKSFLLFILNVLNLLIVKIIKSYIHRTEIYLLKKNIHMKTLATKISAVIAVIALLSVVFVSSSCNKDKTCHGKVTVVDTNGTAISGATVRLAAPSVSGDVVYDGTTDGSGMASFDVKLPAIFDVTATHPAYAGEEGVGVLRLDEPGKDAEVKVRIQ